MWCIGVAILVWILTSFRQTSAARLKSLWALAVNLFAERLFSSIYQKDLEALLFTNPRYVSRTITLFVIACLIVHCNSSYIDYEKKSCKLIEKVVDECIDNTPVWFKKYKEE